MVAAMKKRREGVARWWCRDEEKKRGCGVMVVWRDGGVAMKKRREREVGKWGKWGSEGSQRKVNMGK